ncbi:MAG: hypothetical protein KF758_10805 [Anaerolineales bacterium]|nr:hypothetical protein [Anaerolineales bacterium]
MFTTFPEKTLIVYLDQNKWIDLAKAQVGRADGQKYQAVLEKITEVVDQGKAIFPLSWIHFVETRKKHNLKKRKELAKVMAEISQGIAIVPKSKIMNWELERAIAMAFGETPSPMPSVFGYGMSMIFGRNFIEKEMNSQLHLKTPYLVDRAKSVLSDKEATVSFLVGDDEDLNSKVVNGLRDINEPFVAKMEKSRKQDKRDNDDFQERLYLAVLTKELQPKLIALLGNHGKTVSDFFSLGLDNVRKFFHDVPTLDIEIGLALSLNKHWDRKLKVNDTSDIAFACISIPYCDVVVTEVFLRTLVMRQKLDKKYDTKVISDLNDLLPIFDGL